LLVSSSTITAALSGSSSPPRRHQDDEDESNPFLLRDFAWSKDHRSLVLIGPQSLAWLDIESGSSRLLVSPEKSDSKSVAGKSEEAEDQDPDQSIADASLSPDGRTISFIRDRSLWVVSVSGGPARLVARSKYPFVYEGEPDWPYRHELGVTRAYWWSPDSSSIAYLETDDRAVARYALRSSDGSTRKIVYPRPGGEIPTPRLFVKSLAGGDPTEIRIERPAPATPSTPASRAKDFYLPRVKWLPDGHRLAFERLDRFQHKLELFLADPATGKTQLLLTESDPYWMNLSDDLRFLKDGKRFLWSSERSGFRHLYLYDLEGKQLAQLTSGNWLVTRLNAVDEDLGLVYFTATEKSPLDRHLYQVSLEGGAIARVTHANGTHDIVFAPGGASFVDSYSTSATPPRLDLYRTLEPAEIVASAGELDPARTASESNGIPPRSGLTHHDTQPASQNHASAASLLDLLPPVEFLTLKLHLGAEAHAFLIRPPAFDSQKKYPVIFYLAGGPGEQLVRDAWGGATGLWMRLMAQKGYVIFALDNQGTAGRGHPFEEPIHLRLAAQEMIDQRDGLIYLSGLPWVDTARLGVCGWGYGGSLVLHALLDRPVPFKAGFAGAPIVDWHYYDAVFAERYLDDAVAHADGWDASMALENNSPRYFKSALMVAQGTTDEFVHMENLLTLQDSLLDAGKSAEVLLLSDRGHTFEEPATRLVLFSRMTDFFIRNL
jgi:dipeptidyl-peptidase-4